ncbi:hypothetical protein K504DRAFT_375080, partial [Pleomassaria siparia CBS 279.74]
MHSSRARLICRSTNPFTPSIALWQHFVLLNRHSLRQQRAHNSTETPSPYPFIGANTLPFIRAVDEADVASPAPSKVQELSIRKISKNNQNKWRGGQPKPRVVNARNPTPWDEDKPNSPVSILIKTNKEIETRGDYEGQYMTPMGGPHQFQAKREHLPWVLQPDRVSTSITGMQRLDMEIERFHEYATPSRTEALARRHLIDQVTSHVHRISRHMELEVFGSERTGLALATSDIDLRLTNVSAAESPPNSHDPRLPPPHFQRQRLVDRLHTLTAKLSRLPEYDACTVVYARYPLLTVLDIASGLEVQIVSSNDTSFARATMQKYMDEYPFIRQVYSVVKTMFEIRGLSDTFRGGFGSYPIFMMIVASIVHCPEARRPKTSGEGLKHFLVFWSDIKLDKMGISIEPAEFYDKDSQAPMSGKARAKLAKTPSKRPSFYMSLRDPADPTNDLGRKGHAIKHVQATLRKLSGQLMINLNQTDLDSLLTPIVGPVYSLNRGRRMRL